MKAVIVGDVHSSLGFVETFSVGCHKTWNFEVLGCFDPQYEGNEKSLQGLPLFAGLEEALALPGLDLVIDLTGRDDVLAGLYRRVPPGVRVLDRLTIDLILEQEKLLSRQGKDLEQKRSLLNELRRESSLLREILDSLPDAVLVVDDQNRLEWHNSTFQEITGIDPESLVSEGRFRDPFSIFEDETGGSGSGSLLEKVKETSRPVQFIHFDQGDEMGQRYFRVIISPTFDETGRLLRLVETVRPITDVVLQRRQLEESEHRFRQFVDNVREMITIKDLAGRYLVINQPAASLLGKSPEECLGRTDHDLFPPELADLLTRMDRQALTREAHIHDQKILALKGGRRYLDIVYFPLLNFMGDITGICSISRDVTEETILQQMVIQSEKMAAVGKLAASVAHEINNPLTGVLSFAEELKMDALESDPDNPIIEDYDVIIREALRCRGIVSQLLDYARLESRQSESMNINTVIERSIGLVKKQAVFHDIDFIFNLATHLPEVRFVPSQMQQVFLNLVINAAEAMDHIGRITISSRLSDDGRFVETSVSDTGPGIDPDMLEIIFDPFFSTKGAQGTGQGLSVVKSIVMQHGGTIKASNLPGQGACFQVRLPASPLNNQENWQ